MKKLILIIIGTFLALLFLAVAGLGGYYYSQNVCNKEAKCEDDANIEDSTSSDEIVEIPSCPTCEVCSGDNEPVVTYQVDYLNLLPEGNFGLSYEYLTGRHVYKGVTNDNILNEEPGFANRVLYISNSPIKTFNNEPNFDTLKIMGVYISKKNNPTFNEEYFINQNNSSKINYNIQDPLTGFCYEYESLMYEGEQFQTCVIYMKNTPDYRFSLTLYDMNSVQEFQHMVESLKLKTGSSI